MNNVLNKGSVNSDAVKCSGSNCNKLISKYKSVPIANIIKEKDTGKSRFLSTRKWLCDDCFAEQSKVNKTDGAKSPPTDVNTIAARHGGVIPEGHPDRAMMTAHINHLHSTGNKGEALRLYQRYISGSSTDYTAGLKKSDVYFESYSDGTLDVVFDEDVSETLEKAIVNYLNYCDYEEILDKGLKAEHKSPRGGMTAAGVKAYRRENPDSKLQTAVGEKNPKGKRAKRRRSFCARMGGVKGPMKDKHGKPTRKALALRRWRC